MSSGTLEDKVSALTLAVQESPVHNVKAFESLAGLAKKKSRNHALMALTALKDLLSQGVVLPADRKLMWFSGQPKLLAALQDHGDWNEGQDLPGGMHEAHLISWAYEDWLKKAYFELIQTIETWCNDEIEYARARAVTFVWELLKERPEQEDNLLRLLVNKLGDKAKKVTSRASYLLLQLQNAHPNMKQVVVEAIESDVLLRRGQNLHAKYYAIVTLNQTVLSAKEAPLARKILEIYFGLFKVLLRGDSDQPKKEAPKTDQKMNRKAVKRQKEQEEAEKTEEEMTEKMLAQILTGINRSFPFADLKTEAFDAQLDTLYRITHSSNFNTSVQALILIQMIIQTKDISADRFYRTLYESLLDPRLITSSKQVMYLNLLYKSMKADVSAKRVQAFVKRLLQILSIHDPPFVCSALYLVSEVGKSFPAIHSMASDPEQPDEDVAQNGNGTVAAVYDPRKRDPLYSHADKSCLWELLPLESHFHPSVSLFANRLLFGGQAPPKPDPTLHTLMHFLDRFVYRNARTSGPALRGNSIMQPLAGSKVADLLITERSGARKEMPLNTEDFWTKDVKDVAADEVFFHQYFARAGPKATKAKKIKSKEPGDEGEDEDDIWKALVQSRPDIEGDDDDEDLSDLAELMSDDEDEPEEESEVEINLDSDEPGSQDGSVTGEENGSDSEAGFGLDALESDDDAMRDSEDEVPDEIAVPEAKAEKAKSIDGKKKRKLKSLPLFASVDDYASLLQGDDDY